MSRRPLTRDQRALATSQALSWLGDGMVPVALSITVLLHGGTATGLGIILGTAMACRIAMMLVGGVWADRIGPRRLIVWAELGRAGVQALIATQLMAGPPSIAALAALVGASSIGSALFTPAYDALRARVIDSADRQRVNGILIVLRSTAMLMGPALAGVLVVYPGPAAVFVFNSLTFVISAVLLRRVDAGSVTAPPTKASFVASLRAGWAEVVGTKWYVRNLYAHAVWNFTSGCLAVIGPVIALAALGGKAAVAAMAVAAAAGGLVGAALAMRLRPQRQLFIGNMGASLTALLTLSLIWPRTLVIVCIAAFIGRVGVQFLNVCWDSAVQDAFPPEKFARVVSWDTLGSIVAIPIGNYLAGDLLSGLGQVRTLVLLSVVIAGCGLVPAFLGFGPAAGRADGRAGNQAVADT